MKLIILGSGCYGKTVADVAEQLGYIVRMIAYQASNFPPLHLIFHLLLSSSLLSGIMFLDLSGFKE